MLVTTVATNSLRAFDAKMAGQLQYGSGSKGDDRVVNWKSPGDAVTWPVRVSEPATFEVAINYDAPQTAKAKKVEGDAGKEIAAAHNAAGGMYAVQLGGTELTGVVRVGNQVTELLGRVQLAPGKYEIRVSAKTITGDELMRLRRIELKPVAP